MMIRWVTLTIVVFVGACGGGAGPVAGPAAVDNPAPQISCNNGAEAACLPVRFSVDADFIYKNSERFDLRGVVYVPGQPGYLPWEIEGMTSLPEEVQSRITADLADIRKMGANTVRLWGVPAFCYAAVRAVGGLHILQTIWLDGHVPDFHDAAFKARSAAYIREVIDRLYSAYPNNDPPIVAFLVGNELSAASILSTNQAHPGINAYTGNFFSASGINASEAFILEMADYLRTYEWEHYGRTSLISYANEIRTVHLVDTPFLDFRSQNVYSYAIPVFRPQTQPGSASGTLYQGWIEELKYMHPGVPLLITETGLSVSPNATHVGPPNYGYGGNSEVEQASGIQQNLADMHSASVALAGITIHEYLDAWWKFGYQDSLTQDPDDIEEWFGIVRLVATAGGYSTEPRPAYEYLKNTWGGDGNPGF